MRTLFDAEALELEPIVESMGTTTANLELPGEALK